MFSYIHAIVFNNPKVLAHVVNSIGPASTTPGARTLENWKQFSFLGPEGPDFSKGAARGEGGGGMETKLNLALGAVSGPVE